MLHEFMDKTRVNGVKNCTICGEKGVAYLQKLERCGDRFIY